jgi:lipoprotein-releasing system ATP-binding protein
MSMETADNILSATDLHREFQTTEGTLPVLRGVTLEVKQGQIAAVTGPSGVGKSTLLHLLGGLDRPNTGEISIGSLRLSTMSEADLARFRNERVGFVFQFHYLLSDFTALENVMIPLLLAGKRQRDATERGELLLESVGLIDRKTHRPHELSGGEQQRVAVARALANDPDIVLADEPSGNLDTGNGRKLHDLLFRLNSEKSTSFLIATHNRELADTCHHEFIMADGRLAEN